MAARGVCGGRPTIKYRRLDARHIMGFLRMGDTSEEIAERHHIPVAAMHQVVKLSAVYNYERSYIRMIFSDPSVVPQSHEGLIEGLALYENRIDKGYSLTDCISMLAMRERGISEVLTHDHHFKQEGFTILL